MSKNYYSLGLMSGTSMDGVDASIIQTNGKSKYKAILDKYFEYPKDIYQDLTKLRDKIKKRKDLKKFKKKIKSIEKNITLFHAKAANEIIKKTKANIDFIGFHGHTIFHSVDSYKDRITVQLGDGKLLSKLTNKKVVYDFRQNDLKNGGCGAPLVPIFHRLIAKVKKINLPVSFVNIGGIANETQARNDMPNGLYAKDIGPGNCMLDAWIRKKTKKKYDDKGLIARKGEIINNSRSARNTDVLNSKIFELTTFSLSGRKSFDINDFPLPDILETHSLEDGAAMLTEVIKRLFHSSLQHSKRRIILCGGGRKNIFLIEQLKKKPDPKSLKPLNIKLIDKFGIDGDFVESQAFAYLAIRSYLKLPISFPETTGCKKPCTGGVIVKNF